MSHYFQDDPNLASNIKTISFEVNGLTMNLLTDNGVFSKNRVDEGSLAFLRVLLPLELGKNILDLGCGYGTIGLTLAIAKKDARVTLADVNARALNMCKRNADALNLSQRVTILQSDIYEKIEGPYDSIVVNPPIRAGKAVTYKMYEEAKQYLIDGGSLYVVIRKAQGAKSAAKFIESVFGNIALLDRDKGYYIYQAKKERTIIPKEPLYD